MRRVSCSALLVASPSTARGQRDADSIAFPQLKAIHAVWFVLFPRRPSRRPPGPRYPRVVGVLMDHMPRKRHRAVKRARVTGRHDADYWIRAAQAVEDYEFRAFCAQVIYGLTPEAARAQTERIIREAIGDRDVTIEELIDLTSAREGKTPDQVRREHAEARRRFDAHRQAPSGR
jgi:hypothetical protein